MVCGFRSSIVSKSSGEHLRTAITIDSTIVDKKPGRRNVRFVLKCYFLVNVYNYRILKLSVYNKVTAAYVVLIAWFGLKSWGCFVLEDNFLKVENSTLHFKIASLEDTVWRPVQIVIWRSSGLQWRHLEVLHNSYTTPTHLEWSPQVRGQSRLQWRHFTLIFLSSLEDNRGCSKGW